jgi:hypothetical protein
MKTVRASEIGTYLYCQRAWSYQQKGVTNENQTELIVGTQLHESHGRSVMAAGCLRSLAYALLLAALVAGTVYFLQAALF